MVEVVLMNSLTSRLVDLGKGFSDWTSRKRASLNMDMVDALDELKVYNHICTKMLMEK